MISDPVEFELFKNAIFSVADEMALTIFRTTYSGVLKDNMDYSTAMFDGAGNLVAHEVQTTPTFSLGRSTALFPAGGFVSFGTSSAYAVAPDDRRFLMIRTLATGTSDKLIVVENWFEELKAKLRK